jgi:glyoxylase-like metal-dependent hydrolase (beta-lactamase superfamily II)
MTQSVAPAVHPLLRSVAANIYALRLPLPFALNHVNCYMLQDADGWTVVDAGLNRPEVRAAWQAAWAELDIKPSRIRRIVLTHMHPDHFGLGGWLQEQSGAPVLLSPREAEVARITWMEDLTPARATVVDRYMQSAGVTPEVAEVILNQQNHLRSLTYPHPQEIEITPPDTMIEMGGRRFRPIHAPGHADGQLVFYCAEDRLLLCGDQVLQRITPNIGVWPATEPNPLARYLRSLEQLAEVDVELALPGHYASITDWRGRIAELRAHHAQRLEAMYAAARAGATALDVSYAVFNYDRFSQHEVRFAVAETLAHLEYLAEEGRLKRVEQPTGRIYRAPD